MSDGPLGSGSSDDVVKAIETHYAPLASERVRVIAEAAPAIYVLVSWELRDMRTTRTIAGVTVLIACLGWSCSDGKSSSGSGVSTPTPPATAPTTIGAPTSTSTSTSTPAPSSNPTPTATATATSTASGPTPTPTPTSVSGCSDVPPVLATSGATPVAQCSEAALVAAIAATSTGVVALPAGCTMTFTSPVLVNEDLIIEGNNATISGGGTTHLFEVGRDASRNRGYHFGLQNAVLTQGKNSGTGGGAVRGAQFGTLTFVNVTFTGNVATGTGGEDGGGAIFKDEGGRLTIWNSTFAHNSATNGGAVKALLSDVEIVDSTFDSNSAAGGNNGGGAVFVDGLEVSPPRPSVSAGGYTPDGYLPDNYGKGRFCGVLFRANRVGGQYDANGTGRQGGALFTHVYGAGGDNSSAAGATLIEVERSILENNLSVSDGGALRAGGNGVGTLSVLHSTMLDNRGAHGGAVRLSETDGAFFNTSFIGNCSGLDGTAPDACTASANDGPALGGAIAAFEHSYTVSRLTVARNRAAGYAGGLQQGSTAGSMNTSLVANNDVGNTYGVTRTCGALFTSGATSWQWPAPLPGNANDPGCGAAATADPQLAAIATACSTIAGAATAGQNEPHRMWPPSATGVVPRVNGLPVAGAVCPASVP